MRHGGCAGFAEDGDHAPHREADRTSASPLIQVRPNLGTMNPAELGPGTAWWWDPRTPW